MMLQDALVRFLGTPESAPYEEYGKRTLGRLDVAVGCGANEVAAVRDVKQTLEGRMIYTERIHGVGSPECREAVRDFEDFKTLWMMVAGYEPGIQAYLYAPGAPLENVYT